MPRAWKIVAGLHCAQATFLLIVGAIAIVGSDSLLSIYSSTDEVLQILLGHYALLMLTLRVFGCMSVVAACTFGVASLGLMFGRAWGYWLSQACLVGLLGLGALAIANMLLIGQLGLIVALPLLQITYSAGAMAILHRARSAS